MKLDFLASLAVLLPGLGACITHETPPNSGTASTDIASGTVRDSNGQPVQARVAVVREGGSISVGTSENGEFRLRDGPWPNVVVYATTADDQCAIRSGVPQDVTNIELVVQPAAAIVLRSDQPRDVRCALFQGDVRFEDFTLRAGKPARVVVPEGAIRVQLYESGDTLAVRELRIVRGEEQAVDLSSAR